MSDSLTLSSGGKQPVIGFGTWKSEPNKVGNAVEVALNNGYRHIDCAALYQNEKEIGEALKRVFDAGTVKREELFITSKLWNTDWDRPAEAVKKTLADLGLEYLDLYLVHTPAAWAHQDDGAVWKMKEDGTPYFGTTPVREMWQEMEKLVDAGLVKAIGVSNFPVVLIHDMLLWSRIKPAVQQIEIHPYGQQKANADWCRANGIQVTAYSPLGNAADGGPLHEESVKAIATAHNVSPAQVLIRWSTQHGYSVIPKSTTESRIVENKDVLKFTLTDEQMATLDALERGKRTCDLSVFWGGWPLYN